MKLMKHPINLVLLMCLLFWQCLASADYTEVTYYIPDTQGSPIAAVDKDSGAVLWRKHYKPYGEEIEPPVQGSRIGYTGHAHDHDTGLTYMGARYYDPVVLRFMAMDPVGVDATNPASFNRYAYANNNPYRYVDPDGKEAIPGLSRDIAEFQGRDMAEWDASHQQLGRIVLGGVVVTGVAIVTEGALGPTAATILMTSATGDAPIGVKVSASRYPESAKHIKDAQTAGQSKVLTVDRANASANRKASLVGVPPQKGLDRDEYPPAMFSEGGTGASVRHINPSDNRGAGACIGAQCRGLSEGTKISIDVED